MLRENPDYEVPYPHELLKPALAETLGVIIFQEQVLEVAMDVAGFSSSEAESLRRAMSRKRSRQALEAHHKRFLEGAGQNGVRAEVADGIFSQIIGFSGFGFPKAHSAAFGLLAYQSAWLKVHYGPEFLASLLNEQPMGFYPPDSLVQEGRRSGIEILPPDINSSRVECSTEWPEGKVATGMADGIHNPANPDPGPAVRIGLAYIKGAKEKEMEELVKERDRGGPYTDLGELSSRMPLKRQELEQLAWSGALRSLPRGERVSGLWNVGLNPNGLSNATGRQLSLPFSPGDTPELDEPKNWSRVTAEYGTIGMTLEGHPMALLRPDLHDHIKNTVEAANTPDRTQIEVAGLLVARQRPETANGTIFLLIEDEVGTLNLITPAPVADEVPAGDPHRHPAPGPGTPRDEPGSREPDRQHPDRDRAARSGIKAVAPMGQSFGGADADEADQSAERRRIRQRSGIRKLRKELSARPVCTWLCDYVSEGRPARELANTRSCPTGSVPLQTYVRANQTDHGQGGRRIGPGDRVLDAR